MKKNLFLATTLAFLITGLPAMSSHAITIEFDELATQPVNGLTTNGVTFGFRVGSQTSADAVYNRPGPTESFLLASPVLEGDVRGVLSLAFATPTRDLSFNVAVTADFDLAPAFSVELIDAATGTSTSQIGNTFRRGSLSEGRFLYSDGLISGANINFLGGQLPPPQRFAIDFLTFNSLPPGPDNGGGNGEIPIPPPIALLGAGLLAFGASRWRGASSSMPR